MPEFAEELATFCTDSLQYRDLPPETVQRAKEVLLDSIGIAIRAGEYDSSEAVAAAIDSLGSGGASSDGPCTVWGTGRSTSAERAAFLNGTYVHTPEIDDTHGEGIIHPAASVVPAAVASAERYGAGGRSLVEGIVAGYEVAIRSSLALQPVDHRQRGFHPTGTCGVFGATAAAAVVANRSAAELVEAFGINVSQTSGSRQYTEKRAWTKRIHPGLAARDAILATVLAENGFRGSTEPFAGKMGFLRSYADDPRPERLVRDLGEDFRIGEIGFKPYACCRYLHSPIDCALEIVRSHDFDPADIERVRVSGPRRLSELSRPTATNARPRTIVDAQFSPQYAVAVALVDGAASVDQFDEERLDDPVLHSVMDRISVVEEETMTDRHPEEWPARVDVKTVRGRFSAERSLPSGDPEDPLSWDDLESKFRTLTERLAAGERDAIVDGVRHVDEGDFERLCDALAR